MQLRVFYVSQFDGGSSQDEMNKFLRTHKVIRVQDKEHIDSEGFIVWSFRVWYPAILSVGFKTATKRDNTQQNLRGTFFFGLPDNEKSLATN